MKYDYLIVGSGLFGATFAHEAQKKGKRVLVVDRRKHAGGNIYCEQMEGIAVHAYGPHIFHTNDLMIWNYVQQHAKFNRFTYSPLANFEGKLYNLPFNMNTFYQIWGTHSPIEVQRIIQKQIQERGVEVAKNLEEQAISMVGYEIYEKLIKGYTEKQWGRPAKELPPSIIKRIPLRFTFDNNYFNDLYQGIPEGGYNTLTASLLKGVEVRLNIDFLKDKAFWESQADKIIFSGPLDEFFGYSHGTLEYRSLQFEHQILEISNFQGVATVNYTAANIPYTRIVEHKHFEYTPSPTTIITKEFPTEWSKGIEPYYPINDSLNNQRFKVYQELTKKLTNYRFGGRLADYKYYDMHQVIGSALRLAKVELEK
ncbi:MAG: UDP-galactopyranose mutase [Spirosomataceae bacterium]